MTSARLLKIVFVILLVVTLGELGYYVYYQMVKMPREDKAQATIAINPNPTSNTSEDSQYNTYLKEDLAINPRILWSMGILKRSILKSSILKNEIQGVITDINNEGGIFEDFHWKLRLTVKGNNDQINFFGFSEPSLKQLEVVKLENNKEIPISIDNLVVGDKITYIQVLDLLKHYETNAIQLKIIKNL